MGRSNSTPGLVETLGQVPLEEMWVNPVEPERPFVPEASPRHLHQQQLRQQQNSAASNSSIHPSEEDKSNKGLSGLAPKINFYTSGKLITQKRARALSDCQILYNPWPPCPSF